jgi:hypothetical protein
MNAAEVLCYLTDKQVDSLFKLARKFPQDKLDWKPDENTRSALSQLQEVATAITLFLPGIRARKVVWDDGQFAKWMEYRSKITSVDELERLCQEGTKELTDLIRSTPEADLDVVVEMPFPGEFKVVDLYSYHLWNMSYHEGQINFLSFMLEAPKA